MKSCNMMFKANKSDHNYKMKNFVLNLRKMTAATKRTLQKLWKTHGFSLACPTLFNLIFHPHNNALIYRAYFFYIISLTKLIIFPIINM